MDDSTDICTWIQLFWQCWVSALCESEFLRDYPVALLGFDLSVTTLNISG